MIVVSHRGYWQDTAERNTEQAFRRSFSAGFGTETDVRDYGGSLVIAHDPAVKDDMPFEDFLSIYAEYDTDLPLALNIKSDGLQSLLLDQLNSFGLNNYFVFDMSIPDSLQYARRKIPFYTRMSEYEPQPALIDQASGIWLDAFESAWFNMATLQPYLSAGKQVCIVSPELHKRDPWPFWRWLQENGAAELGDSLMICTDLPEDAQAFFDK